MNGSLDTDFNRRVYEMVEIIRVIEAVFVLKERCCDLPPSGSVRETVDGVSFSPSTQKRGCSANECVGVVHALVHTVSWLAYNR